MTGMWEVSDSSHSRRCSMLVTGTFTRIWRFYCLPTTSERRQSCDPKAADGKNPLPSEATWKAFPPTKVCQNDWKHRKSAGQSRPAAKKAAIG